MQAKVFSSPDPRILEKEVNEWLKNNNWVKILNLTQSSAASHLITIWYEEPNVPLLG